MALVHLLVWMKSRDDLVNLVFAVAATSGSVCMMIELGLMHAQTLDQYCELLRWFFLPMLILLIAIVWFIRLYLKAGRVWLAWLCIGLRIFMAAVNILVTPNASFKVITGLQKISFLGELLSFPVGIASSWRLLQGLTILFFLGYVLDACIAAWRQGSRRQSIWIGGSIFLAVVVVTISSSLMVRGFLPSTATSLAFMLLIPATSYELSVDLFRSRQTARELLLSQERINLAARAADLSVWEWDIEKNTLWFMDVERSGTGAAKLKSVDFDRFFKTVHPHDSEPTRQAINDVIKGGEGRLQMEYRVVRPDGEERWVRSTGNVEFGLNHKPVRLRGVSVDITDHKQAQDVLKESETALKQKVEQMRTILDAVPNYIFAKDIDGRFLLANKAVADVFGVDPEQVEGKTDLDYGATEEQAREYNMIDRSVIESRERLLIPEEQIMRKDGTLGWFQTTKVPYHHPGYDKPAILGVAVEITKRRQAEQNLEKSRDYLEHLTNSIPDAVFSVKLPERTIEWARDSYNVLGHNPDEMIGKRTDRLYSSIDEYLAFGELLRCAILDNRDALIAETMLRNNKGESFPAEVSCTIYRDRGEPVSVTALVRDISDRKKTQEEMKKNETRLKQAQRVAKIGNWEFDIPNDTLTWSDEISRIFEIDKERFSASYEYFISNVHPEDREAVNTAYSQSLETRKPYSVIHRLLMPDGRVKYIHEQCETFYSPEGNPLRSLGTTQDITAIKQAENERARLQNDLAHAQRISTMGHISSALAHELNQPLGAILNNASTVQILSEQGKWGGDTELGEILEDIIADATRAGQVVRKIRGIVKKAEVKFERLNVNALIEEVAMLYQNTFNLERITSSLDLQPDLFPVIGDRVHLLQVLMNLINNACEAMGESARKTLKIRSFMQSPDMVVVSVIDSGTGIDEAKKEKLFTQFFTTKKDGLGMGLDICRSIVEEHDGRIRAENNPAGGATFSFSLKAYRGDSG